MAKVEDVKNAVATTKISTVYDFMAQKKDLIASALPRHITADRLVGMFTLVIKNNPELLNCSQLSLISAMVQTAQLGLMPGNISHCYYVPFNNKKKDGTFVREVQFILGYKGMVELVNRSGQAAILSTECVYANDEFNYELGLDPKLEHKPARANRGEIIGVYAVAKNIMVNEKIFVYLTRTEIDKIRNASKAGQSEYSPWAKWFEEMAKKTAVKRLCKLLPLSVDIQKKIATDETIKTEISPDMVETKDETSWETPIEAEIVADITQKTPEIKAETRQNEAIPPKEAITTPSPDNNPPKGTITEQQAKAIRSLAEKKYGKNYHADVLNLIGGEFGLETMSELSTENAANMIKLLSK